MNASKIGKERKTRPGKEQTALVPLLASDPALANAVSFWTDATTGGSSLRRHDIRRDKSNAVLSFFGFAGKHPAAVTPADVKAWQVEMEGKGLAQTTVYTRICHLSSFFRWAMKDSSLGQYLESNPVSYAHPKAPKPYQTRSAKSLTEEQTFARPARKVEQMQSLHLSCSSHFLPFLSDQKPETTVCDVTTILPDGLLDFMRLFWRLFVACAFDIFTAEQFGYDFVQSLPYLMMAIAVHP